MDERADKLADILDERVRLARVVDGTVEVHGGGVGSETFYLRLTRTRENGTWQRLIEERYERDGLAGRHMVYRHDREGGFWQATNQRGKNESFVASDDRLIELYALLANLLPERFVPADDARMYPPD